MQHNNNAKEKAFINRMKCNTTTMKRESFYQQNEMQHNNNAKEKAFINRMKCNTTIMQKRKLLSTE